MSEHPLADSPAEAGTIEDQIKCRSCAAILSYKPGTDRLKCSYCGAENEITTGEAEIKENDYLSFLNTDAGKTKSDTVKTITCSGCGAKSTIDSEVMSDRCPFCGKQYVVNEATDEERISPEAILPFQIDAADAFRRYRAWLSKLWWAPNDLKKYAMQNEKLDGVYIPYWTYDSDTTTEYTGQRGENYTTTETYTVMVNGSPQVRTRTVTRVRWYPASGKVSHFFDDVLVLATTSLPVKYVEKLEPWQLDKMLPYDGRYLSGFRAESYRVDLKSGFETAKVKMEPAIRSDICSDIGGDHQRIHTMSVNYSDIKFKHILLPLWISAYMYRNKCYRFLVNAQTGEVQGERPYSWVKICFAVFGALAIIGAGVGVYYYSNR